MDVHMPELESELPDSNSAQRKARVDVGLFYQRWMGEGVSLFQHSLPNRDGGVEKSVRAVVLEEGMGVAHVDGNADFFNRITDFFIINSMDHGDNSNMDLSNNNSTDFFPNNNKGHANRNTGHDSNNPDHINNMDPFNNNSSDFHQNNNNHPDLYSNNNNVVQDNNGSQQAKGGNNGSRQSKEGPNLHLHLAGTPLHGPIGGQDREAWVQMYNVFFVFFVTLTIFPAMQTDIRRLSEDFFIPEYLFTGITCFCVFNFTAMMGNILANYIQFPSPKWLWIPVTMRGLLIPYFMLCNYRPELRTFPVYITHDWGYVGMGILMGLTSGYYSSLGMMYAPRVVEPEKARVAGMMAAFFLIFGIVAGVNFTLLVAFITENLGPLTPGILLPTPTTTLNTTLLL